MDGSASNQLSNSDSTPTSVGASRVGRASEISQSATFGIEHLLQLLSRTLRDVRWNKTFLTCKEPSPSGLQLLLLSCTLEIRTKRIVSQTHDRERLSRSCHADVGELAI